METTDRCLILFKHPDIGLDQARAQFSHHWTVDPDHDVLVVKYKDSPTFRIRLARGPQIQDRIRILSKDTPYADALSTYDAWFEVTFDDLDEVLDEINTLMEVQWTLQEATRGYLYLAWNGSLSEP